MKLFKGIYRVESARLKDWDYSTPWWYYITICTKGMKCFFGEIKDGNMVYNPLGEKAKDFFSEIPLHFPITDIDDFIVMPNHIHGIIIINDKVETAVETRYSVSLQTIFGKPQKKSLSTIINNYKGAVTRFAGKNNFKDFHWQPRFYDHIIRNDTDLFRIRTYIENNPLKWELDEYYDN